jgi:hypothetical protein
VLVVAADAAPGITIPMVMARTSAAITAMNGLLMVLPSRSRC